MSWTVPDITLGAVASNRVYFGALGSATGLPASAVGCMLADGLEAIVPATVMDPVMPAAAWPGTEHRNVIPPAGTVTMPLAVTPASATIFVPSAKVRSWSVEPVLWNVTSYAPAVPTEIVEGLNPRSNASMVILSAEGLPGEMLSAVAG